MRRAPLDVDGLATVAGAVANASNLTTVLVEFGSRPRARTARLHVWAWAALSLAALVDVARTRRYRTGWLVADAALLSATNLTRSTWDDDGIPTHLRGQQMSALTITAGAAADFTPAAVVSTLAACASWSWGRSGWRRRRSQEGVPVVAAAAEPLLTALCLALVMRGLRALDAEMRDLRESARHHAEVAAVEAERERQHRLLHDTALQTLEAVSGDWHTDDESLRTLAAADARLLRHALSESRGHTDLETVLAELVETYRRAGLDIELETHGLAGWVPPEAVELAAATREAVVNSLKHAGACTTRVVAECSEGAVTVSVSDDGAGFDPEHTAAGYGIEHSIRRRLAEVGGAAEIDSVPGRGTVVRLSVPLR